LTGDFIKQPMSTTTFVAELELAPGTHIGAVQESPYLSLIVGTLGRRRELERALTSFTQQTMADFEVLIIDQNPEGYLDDIIARFSEALDIRRIRTERGLSHARNIGLQHARGTVAGFPDDDCWYGPDVCQRVADYFASMPGLTLLTGRTLDAGGRESLSGDYRGSEGPICRRDVFRTGNSNTFFLRRGVISSVGGFDEGLGVGAPQGLQSGEETDLVIRCLDQDLRTYYDPSFTVFHDQVCVDRTESSLRRTREYSAGFGYLIRKHGFGPLYFTYRITRSVTRAAIQAAQFDFWNARIRLNWAVGTARGFFHRRPESMAAVKEDDLPQ